MYAAIKLFLCIYLILTAKNAHSEFFDILLQSA